ncbi:hypothetical protein JOF56_010891 [Kibdelosporangium banguiense]|uniref:Uncharacterized protein n=1 Tax=Kibdelosporangium banguiense TaxID=1365924 RepID=A0ABS4U2U3_9PSEU|nr:hypothetical protein [Kibdelosporangium banguiense]MBP2330506.1 hypothetical protein [Kibdelosporangium banguiense]
MMENEMDIDDFDRAIGPTPPSTVDVDRVIARERRRSWLRVGPVALVIIAISAGAVTLSGHTEAPPAVLPPPVTSSSPSPSPLPSPETQTYCPDNTPTAPRLPVDIKQAAVRLSAVLKKAVLDRAAAGTLLAPNQAAQYPEGIMHPPLAYYHVSTQAEPHANGCSGGSDHLETRATLINGSESGSVWSVIGRLGGDVTPAKACAPPTDHQTQESCTPSTGPNGETIVATTSGRGAVKTHRVDVTKLDGTGVTVVAENVPSDGKRDTVAGSTIPPLTIAQLTEIALDSGMTLYP